MLKNFASEAHFMAFVDSALNDDTVISNLEPRIAFLDSTSQDPSGKPTFVHPDKVNRVLVQGGFRLPLSKLLETAYTNEDEDKTEVLGLIVSVHDQDKATTELQHLLESGSLSKENLASFRTVLRSLVEQQNERFEDEMKRVTPTPSLHPSAFTPVAPSGATSSLSQERRDLLLTAKTLKKELGKFDRADPGESLIRLVRYHKPGIDALEVKAMQQVTVFPDFVNEFFMDEPNFRNGCQRAFGTSPSALFSEVVVGGYVHSQDTLDLSRARKLAMEIKNPEQEEALVANILTRYTQRAKEWQILVGVYDAAKAKKPTLTIRDTSTAWIVEHAKDEIIPRTSLLTLNLQVSKLESSPWKWLEATYEIFASIPSKAPEPPQKKARVVTTTSDTKECWQFRDYGSCDRDVCSFAHVSDKGQQSYRGGGRGDGKGGKGGKGSGKGGKGAGKGGKGGKGGKAGKGGNDSGFRRYDDECWSYQNGRCWRGEQCSFLHDGKPANWTVDIRRAPVVPQQPQPQTQLQPPLSLLPHPSRAPQIAQPLAPAQPAYRPAAGRGVPQR